eukprot:Rmarinus@m.17723
MSTAAPSQRSYCGKRTQHKFEVFLSRLWESLEEQTEGTFKDFFYDRYATHLMETACATASHTRGFYASAVSGGDSDDEGEASKKTLSEIFLSIVDNEVLQRISIGMASQRYGSHVLRTFVNILSGHPPSRPHVPGRRIAKPTAAVPGGDPKEAKTGKGEDLVIDVVPAQFSQRLKRLARHFMTEADPHRLVRDPQGSAFCQVLLEGLHRLGSDGASFCDKLADWLVSWETLEQDGSSEDAFSPLLSDVAASHAIEKIFSCISDKRFSAYFKHFLRGKMLEIVKHPKANMALQKALSALRTPKQVETCVAELTPSGSFESLLNTNRAAVVQSTVLAAERLNVCGSAIAQALASAVHVGQQSQMIGKLLTLPQGGFKQAQQLTFKERTRVVVSLPGSVIVQSLLRRGSAGGMGFAAEGFSQVDADVALALMLSPSGGFVIDEFLKCKDASDPLRSSFFRKLRGKLSAVVVDKCGSRALERCYEVADLESRKWIAEELSSSYASLKENFFAKFVVKSVRLEHYMNSSASWLTREEAVERKRKMFGSLLGDASQDAVASKSKKGKKGDTNGTTPEAQKKSKKTTGETDQGTKEKKRKKKHAAAEVATADAVDVVSELMDHGGVSSAKDGDKKDKKKREKRKKREREDEDEGKGSEHTSATEDVGGLDNILSAISSCGTSLPKKRRKA